MITPIMVASENGRKGLMQAVAALRLGVSALDAVEIATRVVEADSNDLSVGYGGLPNVAGEVELDASIMDGRTLRAGAVAALQNYGHPITLARQVMERLPHVLLVGRGAEQFAREIGAQPADQHTELSMERWRERFAHFGLDPNSAYDWVETAGLLTRPVEIDRSIDIYVGSGKPREETTGTVNFLALDHQGNMASAVSTSGIAWKYPGRVGDSAIIGAGNYCDNRYGAAACTGLGELALRVSTAHSLVFYLKTGCTLEEAGMECLRDLRDLDGAGGHSMNFVALTSRGETAGFTTAPGRRYLYQSAEMDEPFVAQRTFLPLVQL
jgi:beta-aspartyl-peptidase (threonine type)